MNNKLIAEAFGTFTLALAVVASVTFDPVVATPVVAGLVLGLFVYTIGSNSGCHINPAVTAGLWSINKISTNDALSYIVAQLLGGLAAFVVASIAMDGLAVRIIPESLPVFIAEIVGMIVFTFGVASVVYRKVNDTVSGLVIGGSLSLGILIAIGLGSGGILNPAVGLALGSVSLSYILGSVIGSVIGMKFYKKICV